MSTEEVAKKVVELVRKQAWYEALDLYDDDIVSVEAHSMGGGSPETRGKEGLRGKVDWWVNAWKYTASMPKDRSSRTIDSSFNLTLTLRTSNRKSAGNCPRSVFT